MTAQSAALRTLKSPRREKFCGWEQIRLSARELLEFRPTPTLGAVLLAFLALLRRVVVVRTQALEWAGPEHGQVATMRGDVIADGRRLDAPIRLAHHAQGRDAKLLRPKTAPPGQPEVEAAWHALPSEIRDRIGIIATDLVSQAFVHGDACVASGSPPDRAVPGEDDASEAIRAVAADAECRRLNELHRVIEAALPDLFGPDGENPEWAIAMEARR